MAKQRLNGFVRLAIWETYGRLCAYCNNPINYGELRIDHVIAESLLNYPEELKSVIAAHGLASNFDLLSLDNLVPCCDPCNAKKLARPLAIGYANIVIASAVEKRATIERLAGTLSTQAKINKGRAVVSAAYEEGNLTDHDILEILKNKDQLEKKFPLSNFITLLGDDPIGEISMEHYEAYLDRRVPLHAGMDEGLRLVRDATNTIDDMVKKIDALDAHLDSYASDFTHLKTDFDSAIESLEELHVFTLRQYAEAITAGYFALTNFDMKAASWLFERPLDILHYLSTASIASKSFIDKPRLGLTDLALIPARLFGFVRITEDDAIVPTGAQSLQDLIDKNEIRVASSGSHFLSIEDVEKEGGFPGDFMYMSEILRADIDGDGIQDILISIGGGPITGTHREGGVIFISRVSADSPFIVPKQSSWRASWHPVTGK